MHSSPSVARTLALGAMTAAGLAIGVAAQAASLTQTTVVNSLGAYTDIIATFQTFDTSLGTLQAVKLGWNLTLDADFYNPGGCNSVGGSTGLCFPSIIDFAFNGATGAFGTATYASGESPYFIDYDIDDPQPIGAPTTFFTALISLTGMTTLAPLGAFNGDGVTDVGSLTYLWGTRAAAPASIISLASSVTGDVTLSYTYDAPTPNPAPATLALMGLGLVGLAMQRRRKR